MKLLLQHIDVVAKIFRNHRSQRTVDQLFLVFREKMLERKNKQVLGEIVHLNNICKFFLNSLVLLQQGPSIFKEIVAERKTRIELDEKVYTPPE